MYPAGARPPSVGNLDTTITPARYQISKQLIYKDLLDCRPLGTKTAYMGCHDDSWAYLDFMFGFSRPDYFSQNLAGEHHGILV
jgi:hypothetical protein